MHQTAQTSEPPPNPAPQKEQAETPYIAFLLKIVQVLLRYGRQLDDTIATKAAHPRFPTLAAGFGTHVHRGILRAMMMQRFLPARAAQGRDIEPEQPPAPAEPADIEALDLKLPAPSQPPPKAKKTDPLHFSIPTLKERESQVRRRAVGTTIAEICLDLGITATSCDGATWDEILHALTHFETFFGVQQRRRETFQHERDKRPETWTFDWRDRPKDAIRQLLRSLLGEPQPA